jgi:hypothetical protein
MTKLLIISTLVLTGFAYAETKSAPDEAPAKTGYEKADNDLFPKTQSYDGKWTVKGFSIVDAQGKVAFKWEDKIRAVQREYMTVSWSPDSQRVILLGSIWTGPGILRRPVIKWRLERRAR